MMLEGYDTMIKGADSYYGSAKRSFEKGTKFSEELVFNILTMAVEKYLVGLMMSVGEMPANHVIKHLLVEADGHFKIDESIIESLSKVDDYLYICSMDDFTNRVPDKKELAIILEAVEKLKTFVHENVSIQVV